jgi:hypothetical protein
MSTVVRLLAIITLLSLLGVFVALGLSAHISGHSSHTVHHAMTGGSDCPFMHHGENLCPMTAPDHLTALRTIFESTLPAVVALTLIIGSVGVIAVTLVRLLPRSQSTHTFFRWRQAVTYSFVYRFYQSLLACGIMQPKVFA